MLKVELLYITQDKSAEHHHLELPTGATVADALDQSGVYLTHPETKEFAVGIYAKRVDLDTVVRDGDRIEIYRPLTHDPKEKRREKAGSYKKRK